MLVDDFADESGLCVQIDPVSNYKRKQISFYFQTFKQYYKKACVQIKKITIIRGVKVGI